MLLALVPLVNGSADYSRTLKLVLEHKRGELTFEALKKKVVALKLPPHSLGCGYTMMPVPAPPPGVPSSLRRCPKTGWAASENWRGDLSQESYDALHLAAHGQRSWFLNCKR